MNHKIRTEMNNIIGITNIFLDMKHSCEQHKYLMIAKLSANQLSDFVFDIFTILENEIKIYHNNNI